MVCTYCFAVVDKKITEYPADTSPTTDDLLLDIDDPGGTPTTKKITILNLFKAGNFTISGSNVGVGSTVPQGRLDIGSGSYYGDGAHLTGIAAASGWTDNGTKVYLTDSSENVGIGTTLATSKLNVKGNVNATQFTTDVGDIPQIQFIPSQSLDTRFTTGVLTEGGNDDDDSFQVVKGLALGTNVFFTINSGGNVGVGTTVAPSKLYVNGRIETNTDIKFADGSVQSTALLAAPGWTDSGTAVYLTTSSDNVGIGTNTADYKVQVNGTVKATEFDSAFSNTPSTQYIPNQVSDTGFSTGTCADGGNDDDDFFQIVEGPDLCTNVRFNLDTAGNVGIGTTNARAKLEINTGDVYINKTSGKLILKSADGTCSSCGPDNSDVWSCSSVACP